MDVCFDFKMKEDNVFWPTGFLASFYALLPPPLPFLRCHTRPLFTLNIWAVYSPLNALVNVSAPGKDCVHSASSAVITNATLSV